ncbi:MAG: methyltransferase domain-containing protein, partial [Pseudomonadota bacterium]
RAHDIAGGNPHFLDCSALIYLCFQKGWTHGNFSIVQSVAGAAYHMMLSAHLRGFRCIWNAGIGDHAALRDLLGLPPIFEVQGALAIGRARAEAPTLKAPRRPKGEVYSWGRFERPAHAVYPVKPAEAYPFVAIRNDDNPFAQWDPAQWSWAQLADFRGYAVWAKSPLAGVYVSRRQGAAQAIELTLLPALPRGAHVVDVMPWGGTGTVALANAVGTADLTLADLSPHNLTFMRARLAAEGVDGARLAFSQMQGPHLSLGDETVDLVVLSQVLEHAPEPEALLDEAHRVLRPGGTVLLSARNSDSAYGARWRAEESRGQVPNQGPFIPIPARKVQALLRARFAIEAECGIGETEGGDAARLDGAAALTGRLYAARGRRA